MSLFGGGAKPATPGLFSNLGSSSATGTAATGGGLFGSSTTTTTQPPAGGAPFGGLGGNTTATAQPQASGGLFGGLGGGSTATATQPQANSALFGGLGGNATTQVTSGFGASTAATQAGGLRSLFGSTTQSHTAPPLLGTQQSALGAAQPQAQTQGLFGQSLQQNLAGSIQQQQQSQGASLGLNASQSAQQRTSYFDSILERNRKRKLGDRPDEDLPQLHLGLGDMRQRMKAFAPTRADAAVDAKAHYLLASSGVDPGKAVRDLNALNRTMGRVEPPARYEAPDTDVEGYLSNLQTQTTLSMIQDGLDRSVKDFDAFLADNVALEWEAQRKRIYQHFGIKYRGDSPAASRPGASTAEHGGFGVSRRSKAAGLAGSRANGSPAASAFGKTNHQKSVIGVSGQPGTTSKSVFSDIEKRMETSGLTPVDPNDRLNRESEARLSAKVQDLNLARIQKQCYPVLHEFASTAAESGEDHSSSIASAYRALIEIVGESSEIKQHADPSAVRERQFGAAYLSEAPTSREQINIRKRILEGSTRYLEKQYYEMIEGYIAKSPRDANVGGIPNVINKVKAYVRLRNLRKDLAPDNTDLQTIDEMPVWALIYYLLRSGKLVEARTYVESNATAFAAIDRSFLAYISAYTQRDGDKRLDPVLQTRIQNEYVQRARIAPENSIDPYRMACYKIVGRCDIRNRTFHNIQMELEDHLWLQLVLAREVNQADELASEVFNLASVQEVFKDYGTRYSIEKSNDNWGLYFFMQILAGLFEEAIAFLYLHAYPDAVHFAIALDYYGLLRVTDPQREDNDLLSYTTRNQPQIKFGHMVGHYTRDFRAANPSAAVDYLALICLNQDLPGQMGIRQVILCHEALRELVLESREFALLLGDIRGDGQRIKGVIEERMRLIGIKEKDDFMRNITIQAASVADDNGRTTDAVLLYHLAQEYDNVMTVINRALSEAVSVPIGQEQMRLQPLKPRSAPTSQNQQVNSLSLTSVDDPVVLAQNMMSLYSQTGMYREQIKETNWADCEALLKMSEARYYVEQGKYSEALDVIQQLQLLPIKANGNASLIRSYATKFSSLSPALASTIPNILTWAIGCTSSQLASMGGVYGGNDGTRQLFVEQLRQDTMDLTTYTSQLRYRFPPSVHEMLARAQSQ
ncbi:Nup93/Nic96-domain-containing protein [Bisporella sp. PMI_857]|nr:Nup93/Nic96-domain-containing protein [Bisporella sp. PMI_857]